MFSVSNYFKAHTELFQKLDYESFQVGIELIKEKADSGFKILTCGNGGSALTASHYITDWNKMTNLITGKQFRGISLCDNVGLVTAYGNDLNFDDIFSGQIANIMDEGDLLVAVSGRGMSTNVLNAALAAKKAGGKVLSLVGFDGGQLKDLSDHCVWVKSNDMQICEDIHLIFGHIVMKSLCGIEVST